MRWVTQAQKPADKQADDRPTGTTGTADIWAAFGLAQDPDELEELEELDELEELEELQKVTAPTEVTTVVSSSEEERENLSPLHAAVKRRLSAGNSPAQPSQPASSSQPSGKPKPAPLTKAWPCKRTGLMRRLDHKGHIETYHPQKGWPSEQDLDPGEQLSPDS